MGAWDNLSIREKADMMRAAIRNGITTLPEIKQAYNEFAEGGNIYGNGGSKKSGGSFYQTHKARWNNYLLRHGVPAEQAARLSGFFSAQDALESGYGTSSAARQKNNFGGMQRLDKKTNKMVNISYPSVDAYMDAKWKMMRSRFGRALNAKTAQEYSDSLNNPKYHGKGYMYALYEGYRDGQPLDVARQTKHMNNYTKALMSIAGEKGFKASPVPAGSKSSEVEAPASIARPENPYIQFVPFIPFNPQAFGAPQAFVAPAREEFEIEQPLVEAANDYAYSPEQLEKEERRQGLNNLSFILGMMNGGNGSSFADTIGMLTGNIAADGGKIHIKPENRGKFTALKKRTGHSATWFKEHGTPAQRKMATFALNARHWKHGYGGHIYDGLTEDDQQMNIPYAGELPDVTVMPRRIANKSWDKVQERWVGDMPTYYAINPETGKEEMLREIGNGKYSTYDDKHVFDVLAAEAAKKEREQWVRNGGTAGDFDKVMLGTLGLGIAPIALPEIAAGALTPTGQTLLAGTLGGEAWEALNHGITGQSWGDNLGDVIGLDKNNYLGRTALGLTNPFYALSPNMVYKGGEAVLEGLVKPMWNAGKEAVYNIADRYMFMPHQNSFTRGIGGEAGLQDLVESGLVRGNPIGTEVTAKAYGKLTRSNRNNFNDIMRDTGIDNIAHRYYNRSLTEEDFNAIKKAAQKYKESTPSSSAKGRISLLRPDKDPLSKYSSYQDYQTQLASDRQTLANATSLDDSGQPLAYFYDDGRNPLTAGHDYAASDYGVRVNNASEYNPRIFDGHLHYSMPEAVPLRDPNVEVFKKGPFGLTYKLDKKTMKPVWQQDLKTLFSKGTNKAPQITAENAASVTPEQWTAAQDAAIARGDMAEAQRLSDLHFKVKAPEANVPDQFHGTHYDDLGNQILLNKGSEQGTNGIGFYTSSSEPYARRYGSNVFKFKVNAKTEDLAQGRFAYLSENRMNELKARGYKGTIDTTSGPMLGAGNNAVEYTFFNPNIYKLRDAVTYDNNGVRIPLGERHNFSNPDIRYGLIPFGIGLTGYGLYNSGKEK